MWLKKYIKKFYLACWKFFVLRILSVRWTIVSSPIRAQSKNFFAKLYYLCINNYEKVLYLKSEPKKFSRLCAFNIHSKKSKFERTNELGRFLYFSLYMYVVLHIPFSIVYNSTCTCTMHIFSGIHLRGNEYMYLDGKQTIFFYIRLYCVEVWCCWDNVIRTQKCTRETWYRTVPPLRITDVRTCIQKQWQIFSILAKLWDFPLLPCKNFFSNFSVEGSAGSYVCLCWLRGEGRRCI